MHKFAKKNAQELSIIEKANEHKSTDIFKAYNDCINCCFDMLVHSPKDARRDLLVQSLNILELSNDYITRWYNISEIEEKHVVLEKGMTLAIIFSRRINSLIHSYKKTNTLCIRSHLNSMTFFLGSLLVQLELLKNASEKKLKILGMTY